MIWCDLAGTVNEKSSGLCRHPFSRLLCCTGFTDRELCVSVTQSNIHLESRKRISTRFARLCVFTWTCTGNVNNSLGLNKIWKMVLSQGFFALRAFLLRIHLAKINKIFVGAIIRKEGTHFMFVIKAWFSKDLRYKEMFSKYNSFLLLKKNYELVLKKC